LNGGRGVGCRQLFTFERGPAVTGDVNVESLVL
jgi:hypothetical protein